MTSKLKSNPSIPEFYSGKNIFITGATGFLGKALIEKLLRNCPEVGNFYITVRPKKGKSLQERVTALANDQIFETLKRQQPNLDIEKKLIPIAGDCTEINLGISPEDRLILTQNVHIIFHLAASVRFDDPLTDAVCMNIRGTRESCQLALDTKNIVAYIQMSTAYVNCEKFGEVEEKIYEPKMDWRKLIEIAEKFDRKTLNILQPRILDNMPNTYVFTKNAAENTVRDMLEGKVPCKIYRPSVVLPTMKDDPIVGWLDNFNGPATLLLAIGVGVLRTTLADITKYPDYIPVDVVTKSLIVCTWDLAVRSHNTMPFPPVEVVHGTAYDTKWLHINAQTWADTCGAAIQKTPIDDAIWAHSPHLTNCRYYWFLRVLVTMLLPSMILDGVLILVGKKPRLTKVQKKIYVANITLQFFYNKTFYYNNKNLLQLQTRIHDKDKEHFDYDFRDHDVYKYVETCLHGLRRYLLKMPDSTIPYAKKRLRLLQRIDFVFKIFRYIIVSYVVYKCFCNYLFT